MNTTMRQPYSRFAAGFSLVELMIAMTIGLILTAMLGVLFQNLSTTNKEQFQSAEQQENGRFAMETLSNDLRTAGFYGEFGMLPPAAGTLPDPCAIPTAADINAATSNSPLAFYVQGYPAPTLGTSASIPTACAAWLDSDTLRPGSDIVVVRRLATTPLLDPEATTPVTSNTAMTGEVYAQTSNNTMSIQYADGASTVDCAGAALPLGQTGECIDGTMNATGAATLLTRKDFSTPPPRLSTAAYIRKLQVHVYFIAKCRKGSGSNGKCTGTDDDIPTLTRLELSPDAGGTPSMRLVPLVEGIEFMKIYYGLDTSSTISGKTVDGMVDSMETAPATTADWQNVVMAEVRLLARNRLVSNGFSDGKSYDLGNGLTYTPSGDAVGYKRHAFSSRIYIENIGGRREFSP